MSRRASPVEGLSLEALGLGASETAAYLTLLDHPRATAAQVADAMGLPTRRAQRLLDAIEARGLVTHSPERPRRYLLSAPDIAIEALILQREKELQRIRGSVGQLHERAALHRQSTPQPLIELITQRESERQVFRQLQASAQRELIFLVRPPILISRPAAPEAPDYERARARGVRYRGIVDSRLPRAARRGRARARRHRQGRRGARRAPAAIQDGAGRPAHRADSARSFLAAQRSAARALVGAARCAVCAVRIALGARGAGLARSRSVAGDEHRGVPASRPRRARSCG